MKKKITVSIGNIMSVCSGSCDFQWLTSSTPIVDSIDISN